MRTRPHLPARSSPRLLIALLLMYPLQTPATDIYAVTAGGLFARFDSATPGTLTLLTSVSGLGPGESVIGMDFRPADGKLYALTINAGGQGKLYRVDHAIGTAAFVATLAADPADSTSPYTALGGTKFGVNFNPVSDRLRVASDTRQNLRVNPGTGLVITDADVNPGAPEVVGVAYTNPFQGTSSTTLYDIDSSSDSLLMQNPPNNGTLVLVGALGVDASSAVGFDIQWLAGNNNAYATLTVGGTVAFYTVNLATGAVTLVGSVGGNPPVIGIAIYSDIVFRNGFD